MAGLSNEALVPKEHSKRGLSRGVQTPLPSAPWPVLGPTLQRSCEFSVVKASEQGGGGGLSAPAAAGPGVGGPKLFSGIGLCWLWRRVSAWRAGWGRGRPGAQTRGGPPPSPPPPLSPACTDQDNSCSRGGPGLRRAAPRMPEACQARAPRAAGGGLQGPPRACRAWGTSRVAARAADQRHGSVTPGPSGKARELCALGARMSRGGRPERFCTRRMNLMFIGQHPFGNSLQAPERDCKGRSWQRPGGTRHGHRSLLFNIGRIMPT